MNFILIVKILIDFLLKIYKKTGDRFFPGEKATLSKKPDRCLF